MKKQKIIKCPKCESENIWKYGKDYKSEQKFVCRNCGHIFKINGE